MDKVLKPTSLSYTKQKEMDKHRASHVYRQDYKHKCFFLWNNMH